jgi:hypothetical protein
VRATHHRDHDLVSVREGERDAEQDEAAQANIRRRNFEKCIGAS